FAVGGGPPGGHGSPPAPPRRAHTPPANPRQGSGWPEPYVHDQERALDIIETLAAVGDEHGVSVARTCLAWLKDRPGITSLIIGARTEAHLRDNLAATELKLTEEQSARIEAVTRRQPLYPYWHRFTAGIDRFDPAEQPFLAEHQKTLDARQDK
ncbi:aldo/keto reductase, partial [Pseudomonas carnis]|uniref:aldo/keto reductase n=1 Tax=Pseudomonas carnis TaxID=2487355 RepID=UPI001F29C080